MLESTVARGLKGSVLAAAAVLALAGCGGDDDNSNGGGGNGGGGGGENAFISEVEDRLQEGLSEEPGPGNQIDIGPSIEVASVECPQDVEKREGARFECKMEANDLKDDVELTGTVTVTLEDAEGRKLKYQTELAGPGKTVRQSGTV